MKIYLHSKDLITVPVKVDPIPLQWNEYQLLINNEGAHAINSTTSTAVSGNLMQNSVH